MITSGDFINFQTQLLGLLVQKPEQYTRLTPIIPDNFFDQYVPGQLWKMLKGFVDRFNGTPNRVSMISMVEQLISTSENDRALQSIYMDHIEKIYTRVSDADVSYITESIENFIKQRKIILAAMEISGRDVHKDDLSDLKDLLSAAVDFTIGVKAEELISIVDFDPESCYNTADSIPVPTGMSAIDEEMKGGLRPGEMGIICGPYGTGKSQVLTNIAIGALMSGKSFFYLTNEMSIKSTMQRLIACITGELKSDIESSLGTMKEVKQKIKSMLHEYPNMERCCVMYKGALEVSVPELEAILHSLYDNKQWPDVIIIDYADQLKPTTNHGDLYRDCGTVYLQLSNMTKRLMIPVWTASQASRGAIDAKFTGANHLADSNKKGHVADTVYSLSRDPNEHELNLLRITSIKQRHHSGGRTHCFETHFDKSRLKYITSRLGEYKEHKTGLKRAHESMDLEGSIGKAGWNRDKLLEKLMHGN